MKIISLLFGLGVLLMAQLACSSQVTAESTQAIPAPTTEPETQAVQNTVEASTATNPPVPSDTPLPINTPTVNPTELPVVVTASPSPQPTPTPLNLLTARIEGDPQKIDGTIFWPDYGGPAGSELVFWVEVHNPSVGKKDGAGIASVDFAITDSNGQTVYSYTAKESRYCAFGGKRENCNTFNFNDNNNTWPGTQLPIQNGDFTLTATVNADDGGHWSGTAAFSIKLPG